MRALSDRTAALLPGEVVPDHFRQSAVLLLLTCVHDEPVLVLTERAAGLRAHPSDICLPGGSIEADETVEQAALREGSEELGIDLTGAVVAGTLDQCWTGAGHTVVPVAAWHRPPLPSFDPPSDEVATAFCVPLSRLADPAAHSINEVHHNGHIYHDDVLEVDGWRVYGPTADAVIDLLAWLTETQRDRMEQRAADLVQFAGSYLAAADVMAASAVACSSPLKG